MKKTITLLLLVLTIHAKSQTITYANFSPSFSATMNVLLANNASFNVGLTTTTGTGVTWNATALTAQSGPPTIHFIYGATSGTPYASLYTSSNYAQYDPALVGYLDYNFKGISADSLVDWGTYSPSGAHEIFQDPDKRLIFPFSYGNSFNNNYAKTNYSDATTISSNQTGSRTVTFNGFGSLVLPQGTFTNVAMISELRTNNIGPNSTSFTWFDISNGKQLMFYSENNGSVTSAYTADIPSGINDPNSQSLSYVFPNPFSEKTTIHIGTSTKAEPYELTIFDICGKAVRSEFVTGNDIVVNRDNLSNGVYFYTLKTSTDYIANGKLVVE